MNTKIQFHLEGSNPFTNKPVFFMSDPPHLMKKLRNNLFNSGFKEKHRRFTRKIKNNGKHILWEHVNDVYTAKFAQAAAGLLPACCGMSSTGRMSDAFARHVVACRHMPATDCRQICCKLLRQNCSSAVGNRPASSCYDRTAAMLLWTELQQAVVNKCIQLCE